MQKLALRLLTLFLFIAGLALWAADIWVAKPYTEWTEKDLAKIMTDSPWAKKVSVAMSMAALGGGPAAGGGGGSKGGRSGGFSGGGDTTDPGVGGSGGGGGGGRGGRGGGGGGAAADTGGGGGGGGGGTPEVELIVRWQSAPTVRQALAKAKFGAEAATSPDAKKMLEPDEMFYVIWVSGLPSALQPHDEESKKMLLALTTLSPKDKDAIVAADVIFNAPKGAPVTDAHFLFPRKAAISVDDKEADFVTKFGKAKVQAKFVLKNMVINGKLGL
jgi:hypothetical protein